MLVKYHFINFAILIRTCTDHVKVDLVNADKIMFSHLFNTRVNVM